MNEAMILEKETLTESTLDSREKNNVNEGLKIEYRVDGKLWASQNGKETVVLVSRCFPWSEPHRYISLRDDDENEIALIDEPGKLDKSSQAAVEQALAEAGFVMKIVKVVEIEEDYEIRSWKVQTRQGQRTFQTMLDDWPLILPSGSLLIRDVAGDLFLVDSPDELDEKSRDLISAFVG